MAWGFTSNNVMVWDSVSGTILPSPFTIDTNGNCGNTMIGVASINAAGTPSSSTFLRGDGTWSAGPGGGGGTVTSVTFTGDGTILSSTPSSAVTTSGTITGSLLTQTPNFVLAGPASGVTHLAPTFRALVALDVPTLNQNTSGTAANLSGTPTLPSGTTLVAPVLGTPASGTLTNCTGLPAASIVAGTLASGMTLVAPALGTPASGVLTNCTGLPTASVVGGAPLASPTFTGTVGAAAITATGLTTTATFATTGLCTKYDNIATTGQGLPSLVGIVTTGTHTAAIASTSLLAAPVAGGFYRISAYMKVTVATSTPVAGPITITYKDNDGVAQSVVMALTNAAGAIATVTGSTTATPVSGDLNVYTGSGTAIAYTVGFSGTGTYELVLKCESF